VLNAGILSLASRLGLGAGICISNILDTEWGQNLFDKNLLPDGDKTFSESGQNLLCILYI
jgi:hypothetical protein